jgi:hypothetical protein
VEKSPKWQREEEVLAGFCAGVEGWSAYRRNVEEVIQAVIGDEPWDSVNGSLVLGGKKLLKVDRQKRQKF